MWRLFVKLSLDQNDAYSIKMIYYLLMIPIVLKSHALFAKEHSLLKKKHYLFKMTSLLKLTCSLLKQTTLSSKCDAR